MAKIKAGSIDLNYEPFGQGEPLLLIMGFGLPGAAWAPSLPFMAGLNRVLLYKAGAGKPPKPHRPDTIPPQAGEARNLDPAHASDKAAVYRTLMSPQAP